MTTKQEQRATLPDRDTNNAYDRSSEKEVVDRLHLVALGADGELHEVIDARWYMARRSDGASPVYCSVWVHGAGRWFGGNGRATGYGYCKRSAAFQDALDAAGIKLALPVDGRGMECVHDAMHAIAIALGYTGARRIVG